MGKTVKTARQNTELTLSPGSRTLWRKNDQVIKKIEADIATIDRTRRPLYSKADCRKGKLVEAVACYTANPFKKQKFWPGRYGTIMKFDDDQVYIRWHHLPSGKDVLPTKFSSRRFRF